MESSHFWRFYQINDCHTCSSKFRFLTRFAAFLFTGPYRELAKVLGRKIIIFMNICGFAIDSCFFIAACKLLNLVVAYPAFHILTNEGYFYTVLDIRWIYVAPFLWVIGGGTIIFQSLLYTYISESVESKHL
jgi:hypothetical protein